MAYIFRIREWRFSKGKGANEEENKARKRNEEAEKVVISWHFIWCKNKRNILRGNFVANNPNIRNDEQIYGLNYQKYTRNSIRADIKKH